jgi:metal-sulfur cluster biosynthetic enzyme
MNDQKPPEETTEITQPQVYEALHECYDPELPVNIVDLGLVYDIKIIDDWVGVKMTLTSPGCGMSGQIANMVRDRVLSIPNVHECDVRIVWDPQWNPSMMSETAKKALNVKE